MSAATTPGALSAVSLLAVSLLGFTPGAYLGLLLIILGTLVGAWSVRHWPRHGVVLLPAACGVLLAMAVVDLLPHALDEARKTGLPMWAVPAMVVGGCVVVPACGTLLARCDRGRRHGVGTAAALVLHRVIEGMAVVLFPSLPVVAALVAHSAGEGLALTALLEAEGRRRLAPWLALACAGPLLGGLATEVARLPETTHALLVAAVAGVLLRGAAAAAALVRRRHLATQQDGPLAVLALGAALTVTTVVVLLLH
jgi:ZIP family zinc transporter